uniref:C-type lectin domain-containing protein n=1 Tax=Panagrolaimus superbus TaxID=310955 RepID=A0A914YUN2_9BILA
MCYKFTPSNSESFDLFEKKCSCEHGTPRKYKHNGINNRMNNRHKRHLRGFPHQNIRYAAPFQPRPQFVVAPRANNNYANQAARAPQSIPLVDHNTYECIRQPDNCYKYPKPNIPEDNCPPGWIFIRSFGSNCYKFHPAQTWHEAERTCISQNAHLASARVGKEMDVLSEPCL